MNKKILFALLAGTILSANVARAAETATDTDTKAQEVTQQRFDQERRKRMAEQMAKDLNLTDEQIAQAEQLREESRKKIEPLMKQMGELRQQMDAERRANMEAFEKILTEEQKARFDQMRKSGPRHDSKRMMRGMDRAPNNGEMLPPPEGDEDFQGDGPRRGPRPDGGHDKDHKHKGGFVEE
jgi:Spy/CpxP family protein refolding chaperone